MLQTRLVNGIPCHFTARTEPLHPALRQTLGLSCSDTFTVKEDKPPRRSEPRWESERRHERARLTGTMPLSSIEPHRLSPQGNIAGDDDYTVPDRTTTAATRDQRDERELRNRTRKVITSGKRRPVEVEWLWRPQPHHPLYDVTIMYAEREIRYTYHDSHGKHGRKPRYKDHH